MKIRARVGSLSLVFPHPREKKMEINENMLTKDTEGEGFCTAEFRPLARTTPYLTEKARFLGDLFGMA